MEMLNLILGFAVQVFFTAGGLWCGMKITKIKGDFTGMLVIAFVCSLLGFHQEPWGLILSLLSMFLLLLKFSGAKLFPDGVVIVLLSWAIGFFGKFMIKYLAGILK